MRKGYDLEGIAKRVSEVLGMEPDEIFSKGRQAKKVKARSLLCFWAARELGLSHTSLAKILSMKLLFLSDKMDLEGHVLYLFCSVIKSFGNNGFKLFAQELAIIQKIDPYLFPQSP